MIGYSDYDTITTVFNIVLCKMQNNYTSGYFVVNSLLKKRCLLNIIVVAKNMLFLI